MMARQSASPSPPPTAPTADSTSLPSHRYLALRRVYTDALHATLRTNSYENFSACFPTPATYCPGALKGVWNQLNTRLEQECLKDFEKICEERDIERGLGGWEALIDAARVRKDTSVNDGDDQRKPMHLLGAQELYAANLAPSLSLAEKELNSKLEGTQDKNKEIMASIADQRAEMQRLVEQLESIVEDVEGAARAVEDNDMRQDLKDGISTSEDVDVKMGG